MQECISALLHNCTTALHPEPGIEHQALEAFPSILRVLLKYILDYINVYAKLAESSNPVTDCSNFNSIT